MIRKGDWMQTISGKRFWPLDPHEDDIDLNDIAHALSMMCRFNGHCSNFYSVAEHSVLVSKNIDPKYAIWGLLHDASEAYIADIVRPAKRFMPEYKIIEHNIMKTIYRKFDLDIVNEPQELKLIDNELLNDEAQQLFLTYSNWNISYNPIKVKLHCYTPQLAKEFFIDRAKELNLV